MARTSDGIGGWLRKSPSGRFVGAHLGAFYIRLVNWTVRWEHIGAENYARLLEDGTGVIATAWHGRLFMAPHWVPPGRRAVAMISRNDDGELIAALVRRFRVVAIRGSTYDRAKQREKGGAEVYSDAVEELTQRHALLAITPDGPRGPRMQAQRGIAQLSIQTRAPIQPIAFSVRRGKTMRSWDRFLLPWPFGRGVQIFGDPLWPPETEDEAALDAYLARIAESLNDLTARADEMCGRDPVLPK